LLEYGRFKGHFLVALFSRIKLLINRLNVKSMLKMSMVEKIKCKIHPKNVRIANRKHKADEWAIQ
jgi:hypothetical protein